MTAKKNPVKKPQHKKPQHRKHLPVVFKLFFVAALILLGGGAFQYFQEKHIVEQIQQHKQEKEEMQEALGWGSELKIDKTTEPPAHIRFMLRDKNHTPIQHAVVSITLSFANDNSGIIAQNTITLPLTMAEPGVYRGLTNLPMPGRWDASVSAQIGKNTYQVSERVTLP